MVIEIGDLIEIDGDGIAIYLGSENSGYDLDGTKFMHHILTREGPEFMVNHSPKLFSVGPTFTMHRLGQIRLLSSHREAIG